jgi:hypothetical protein
MRGFLVAAIAVFFATHAMAQTPLPSPGPFGLTWGVTRAEVEGLGVQLSEISQDNGWGKAFTAHNLPKALGDMESAVLAFGYDDKLWRVGAVSKSWENDGYGSRAVARFDELKGLLSERYGSGEPVMKRPANEFYEKPDNFTYSLYMNERIHAWGWENADMDIEVSLRASTMNTIYYLLIYEYKPLRASVQKSKQSQEKDAL